MDYALEKRFKIFGIVSDIFPCNSHQPFLSNLNVHTIAKCRPHSNHGSGGAAMVSSRFAANAALDGCSITYRPVMRPIEEAEPVELVSYIMTGQTPRLSREAYDRLHADAECRAGPPPPLLHSRAAARRTSRPRGRPSPSRSGTGSSASARPAGSGGVCPCRSSPRPCRTPGSAR